MTMLSRSWLTALTEALDVEFGAAERRRLLAGAERFADAAAAPTEAEFADWFTGLATRLGRQLDQDAVTHILQQCCPCGASEMFAEVKRTWAECDTIPQFAAELERRRVFGKSIAWRDGGIIVTKPPICECGAEYQHDHRGRYAASCHCDMASRLPVTVPATFCACGGGFYQKMFREVWGVDTRVETVSTVISGGRECAFAICVPQEYRDAEAAVALYWRTLARARGVEAHSRDGVAWVTAQSECGPARIYHLDLLDLPPDTRAERLNSVKSGITRGDLPNGILSTPAEGPENLLSLLSTAGFAVDMAVPCMMTRLDANGMDVPPPASVTIERVEARESLAAWDIVATDLYGLHIMDIAQLWDLLALPSVRFYLASYDGAPAAACMTIREGDLAALEMVATRAPLRRRGIGAAMVRHVMADLHEAGVRSLHLRAEPDAIPFYGALGFQTLGPRILATVPEV